MGENILARYSNCSSFNKNASQREKLDPNKRSPKPGVAGVIKAVRTKRGAVGEQDSKVYDVDFNDGDFEANIDAKWIKRVMM